MYKRNPDARTECVNIILELMGYPRDDLFEYPHRADDSLRYIARAEQALDKILALTHPVVDTVEELDNLPDGSIVKDFEGEVYNITPYDEFWRVWGTDRRFSSGSIDLPACVLYRPEVNGA